MRIARDALAGTLESSDVLVRVHPSDELAIEVRSTVLARYGADIRRVVADQLESLEVTSGQVFVDDKGALEFVIRARVEGAVTRADQGGAGITGRDEDAVPTGMTGSLPVAGGTP
ncbi:citrate lyase subunit gamma (acyl carrier protein) [Kineosphaera limosa]|uniref:Citrate lyase gamma subunit n=1 Tax=Kineosphaera limosa NBRC 100340 TaxID=1184609 RepID=K6WA05_9MICO|nr:citrate lyase acyl carrier protein [Kineosphaera limosa]NYE02438.1 citrate lyase subunit gamma (acyl carrier protein) [Kineosphaera limosa]GAB96035.1 citrate lyase gamma subunit [Kineosphaera limosa NBRC 100340]